VTLLGRVGIDPQLRGNETHPVIIFSLATNVSYKTQQEDKSEYINKTDWHNVAVFRPFLRESVQQNVTKGMRVLIQGRIMYGTVEDKMGIVRHTTTIVAEDVIRLSSPAGSRASSQF
jgi:single-strand DNA-binding protein